MTFELLSGVTAPVLAPFKPDLSLDKRAHLLSCRWFLANDPGLAAFGTNSEANSLSVDERIELLDDLLANGIPALLERLAKSERWL